MAIISVKNLTKSYQSYKKEAGMVGSLKSLVRREYFEKKAVDSISFEIEEGELIGFIGPNGAGKTTTLKCLSGLLYPTNGELSVMGFTPYNRKEKFLKQMAIVMGQKNQLWWDLPAIESYILNKEIYEIPKSEFDKTLGELTELLDVKNILNVQVRKLSLGQRMKMELIGSLLHKPKVLFLDEPTIGLDVFVQKKLRDFIRDYNKRYKATIILTSHYMQDVKELCNRVIVINYGKLIYDGSLNDIVKKYSPEKRIIIILSESVERERLEKLGRIEENDFPRIVLSVPLKDYKKVAAKLLEDFPVEDLNIEDPAIEGVIRDIFSNEKA